MILWQFIVKGGTSKISYFHLYFQQHESAALILLDKIEDNENINISNCEQKTPLHIAAKHGLVSVVQMLISKGASVNATDENGMSSIIISPNFQWLIWE